jgi:hypothetical protein
LQNYEFSATITRFLKKITQKSRISLPERQHIADFSLPLPIDFSPDIAGAGIALHRSTHTFASNLQAFLLGSCAVYVQYMFSQ